MGLSRQVGELDDQTPKPTMTNNLFAAKWRLPCMLVILGMLLSIPVYSQVGANAGDRSAEKQTLEAVGLMKKGQWKQAHQMFERIIAEWGNDAFYKEFPPFGTVYYNRGFCEMKLKMYAEAAKSFEICYRDFPDQVEEDGKQGGHNVYRKTAVFQWAAAEQYQENFEEAIKLYQKFRELNPEPRKDSFNPGALDLNQGICYARMDDRLNAEKYVSQAIANAKRYRLAIASLWPGFLAVLDSFTRSESSGDIDKAVAFIDKNAPALLGDVLPHAYFSSRVLKLAQEAVVGGHTGYAWRLYGMIPKTADVIRAGKIADPSTMTPLEKHAYETWQSNEAKGEPLEVATYFGLAKMYEGEGSTRAEFAIYDYMGTHFDKTQYRPQILYLATKKASDIGQMIDAQQHGLAFLKEFPEHELRPDVAALLLSSMFFNGEYERCVEIAGDLRESLAVGSEARDLPDFVYSGSLYYLGRYQEAQPELDQHVEKYPESPYIENSSYYQASNNIKLYEWQRASELLDAWLEKYEPESSPLLDVAYLDRATCYFALSSPQNNGNSKALEYATKVVDGFPQSNVLDRAHSLIGDIRQNDGNLAQAEESYLKALEIALEEDHLITAASAQMQLVAVSVGQEKHAEAIKHYDTFFEKYPDSFYAPNAAVSALPAFEEAAPERLNEALDRIKDLIVTLGENRDADGVERTLNAYSNFLLKMKDKKPQDVIQILDDFPNKLGDRTLQAWLLITKIGIIEEYMPKDNRMLAKARVYYQHLETDFEKEELSDFILYRLGAKIAETSPFKAAPWFEAVSKSEDPEMAMRAQLQLARIQAGSSQKAEQDKAISNLVRIRKNLADNPELVGMATLALARLYHDRSAWSDANKEWKAYMENKSYRKDRTESQFKLGESYEKLGKSDEALLSYRQVIILSAANLDFSAEAVIRIAKLVWARGDQVTAFQFLNTYHYKMKGNKHPKVDEMESLRLKYIDQLKSSGKWKDEYLKVSEKTGKITPAKK